MLSLVGCVGRLLCIGAASRSPVVDPKLNVAKPGHESGASEDDADGVVSVVEEGGLKPAGIGGDGALHLVDMIWRCAR